MTYVDHDSLDTILGGGIFGTLCGLLEDWLIVPCPYR